jgi:hypothetical protein
MDIEKRKTPCPQSRRFGSNDQGQTVQHAYMYSGRLIGCARPQMLGRLSPSISVVAVAARHASACDRDRGRGRGRGRGHGRGVVRFRFQARAHRRCPIIWADRSAAQSRSLPLPPHRDRSLAVWHPLLLSSSPRVAQFPFETVIVARSETDFGVAR